MYLDNQVIERSKGFSFEIVSNEDVWGNLQYQAIICNDQFRWVKKVGFKTDSYVEACQELKYYMERGFKFGKVQYRPNSKGVAAS